jgi:predicted transcriptional regulator
MSTLSVRLPDSLHNKIKKLSKKDNISLNQFIASAVTEKITAIETETYLSDRAKKGKLDKYLNVLSKVTKS